VRLVGERELEALHRAAHLAGCRADGCRDLVAAVGERVQRGDAVAAAGADACERGAQPVDGLAALGELLGRVARGRRSRGGRPAPAPPARRQAPWRG
jgi:hypothetical protein